jgi:ribosomal protein L40E
MAKKKASSPKKRTKKVCNKCGAENALNAKECSANGCKSQKFAPKWIKAMRPVSRQVSVQVTVPNPKFGKADDRITLSKWWPGGRATYHIPNQAQWDSIKDIVDNELGPFLGWKTTKKIISEIERKARKGKDTTKNYQQLAEQHPDLLKKLAAAIDPQILSQKDFDNVIETFGDISDAMTNANAGFREAFLGVVKQLPKQKQRALEDLSLLLQGWSLQAVTNVAQQVRARMETVELFENRINDPNTFEIIGDDSIHRILERSMWLVDEKYWLMQSNKTLLNFIGKEMSKRDKKKYGKKRPDFACGTVGNTLISVCP